MTKATRRRLGVAAWRGVLSDQARSGVSVAQFCAREGVSSASFYKWRSRLAPSRQDAPSDAVLATTVREDSPTAFVDLGPLGGAGRFELRLDLGGGLVLQLARG